MSITKEQLLGQISSYDILNFYLKPFHNYQGLRKGQNISNPFLSERQKTPSFNIYNNGKFDWHFNDFATGDKGSCFDLVMKLFGLTFQEAMEKISADMNVSISANKYAAKSNPIKANVLNGGKGLWGIIHKPFTKEEIEYWLQFGITVDILNRFHVQSVKSYSATSKSGKAYSVKNHSKMFIFSYKYGDGYKLYKPLEKKHNRFQFLGEKPSNFIYGFEQLSSHGEIVFITGGEKDAMTLSAKNYNAITLNSETARLDANLVNNLRPRFRVILVLYDNDETGVKESNKIATEFGLKNVVLPNMENGKDISDFFANGGTAKEFDELINRESNLVAEEIQLGKHFITALELLKMEHDEIPWLLENLIPQVGIGSMIGSSDGGKSAFWRQCALNIITKQEDFLGFRIKSDLRTVYFVSSEDDVNATSILLKMQLKGTKFEDNLFSNLIFLFDFEELLIKLDAALTIKPAALIVLDAYGDLFDGKDSNQSALVRAFLKNYAELAKKHKCFILFIHHVGKRTEEKGASKHNAIGSQSFEAKMRILLDLSTDDGGRKILSIVKGNYISSDRKNKSTILEFHEDNLSFTITGETIPIGNQTSSGRVGRKHDIDWNIIFGASKELKRKDIMDRLEEQYQVKSGTASNYISKDLEQIPGKGGFYRLR